MEYLKGSYSTSNTQGLYVVAQGSPNKNSWISPKDFVCFCATRCSGDPRDPWLRDSPRHTLPVAREKPKNRKTEKLKKRKTEKPKNQRPKN